MNSLFGVKFNVLPPHLADLATRKVWKVERNPIKKRRKGYRVAVHKEPCALMFNPSAVGLVGGFGGPQFALHPEFACLLTGLPASPPKGSGG